MQFTICFNKSIYLFSFSRKLHCSEWIHVLLSHLDHVDLGFDLVVEVRERPHRVVLLPHHLVGWNTCHIVQRLSYVLVTTKFYVVLLFMSVVPIPDSTLIVTVVIWFCDLLDFVAIWSVSHVVTSRKIRVGLNHMTKEVLQGNGNAQHLHCREGVMLGYQRVSC